MKNEIYTERDRSVFNCYWIFLGLLYITITKFYILHVFTYNFLFTFLLMNVLMFVIQKILFTNNTNGAHSC